MANKNNNNNQTITLLQGGGALHGIGETFSPDLHTGTGNSTVPIPLPPCRNGYHHNSISFTAPATATTAPI